MSARGDAARRRRWGEKDNSDAKQLEAMADAWLSVLPEDLACQLEQGLIRIFGARYGAQSLNSTRAEQRQVLDLIEQINLALAAGHDQGVHQPGHEENSMSLTIDQIVEAIKANTAAVEANTAALAKAGKGGGTVKVSEGGGSDKPKHTREELAAIMGKVKEAKGADVAKGLIKDVGGSVKLADVEEGNIDKLYTAASDKLKEKADDDM